MRDKSTKEYSEIMRYNGYIEVADRLDEILTELERARQAAKHWQDRYDGTAPEIESLKAITELAVKGLKWYASFWNHDVQLEDVGITSMQRDRGELARSTVSEIERLSHEQNS